MTTSNSVRLPPALLSSEVYNALNAEQRGELTARLNYCDEIATKAAETSSAQGGSILEIIDDIEVDAMSIMSAYDPSVSPWLIHTSWTFDCDRREMAGFVAETISILQSAAPGLHTSREHAKEWLVAWAKSLRQSLNQFGEAATYTEAITTLIVIDALVSAYLVFAALARLNGNIS